MQKGMVTFVSMYSVIIRILIYFCLIALLTRMTGLLLPDGWENLQYSTKKEQFLTDYLHDCNTLFMGSSRTYAHVDPIVFDSLNALAGVYTNSYVLANSASFFVENILQIKALFSDELNGSGIKYLILELDDQVTLELANLYKPRKTYFVTWRTLRSNLSFLWQAPIPQIAKLVQSGYYLNSCIVTMTEFGYGTEKLRLVFERITGKKDIAWMIARKGHRALDYRLPRYQEGTYKSRHDKLLADTTIIQKNFDVIMDGVHEDSTSYVCNTEVLKAYLELADVLGAQGVRVTFVLPIRGYVRPDLLALFQALPDGSKINMGAVAAGIPALHYAAQWFDPGHLSQQGVQLYTPALSSEWIHLIKNQDAKTE